MRVSSNSQATAVPPVESFPSWPFFAGDEIHAATEVLRSGRVNYWTGTEGRRFETEFAAFAGCGHAVAVANGTVALELALRALGVGQGDEVITPSRAFIACGSAVCSVGARPVFADVDRDSQNITADTIRPCITQRTRAILAVHLAGWPCDMDPILDLAREFGLYVIEDCAQAHGAHYKGKPVGSFGDVAAFSFCQDKIMTTAGEGGMVTTNSEALWKKMWAYKDHGKDYDTVYQKTHPPGFRWLHESLGTNWRLTEVQSAVGRIQLSKVPGWVATRRSHASYLTERLSKLAALRMPLPADSIRHAFYKWYAFVRPEHLREDWTRERIMQSISGFGVPCSAGSCSEVYLEKAFSESMRPAQRLPIARELGETCLMFQVHPTLEMRHIERTAQVVEEVMAKAMRGDVPGAAAGMGHAVNNGFAAAHSVSSGSRLRMPKDAQEVEEQHESLPALGRLMRSMELGEQIREVAVEDLLGRGPVQLDQEMISKRIERKVVMVTGAAGSIGSELCRQIARFHPYAIIGFDIAETPLFHLTNEMARDFPGIEFHPEIGCVTRADTLQRVMRRYAPSIVYHAAAYKHVPMMELNAFAAIENNVFGTWQVAQAAAQSGVDDFVLISTDKAVRPTSVMGASKRVAELAIRALHQESGTKFVAVRFGNVLGSSGSVVPIFKEQIAAGGPVTVTHPEVTRFFMTIAEAAELVLQAFSMGKGGEVFVLDMGEPVRIVDLARNLILLSGLQPGRDVEIVFTGLRPGEKLHEELCMEGESLAPTAHAKIGSYFASAGPDSERMRSYLLELQGTIDTQNIGQLVLLLKELIPDYQPDSKMVERDEDCAGPDRSGNVQHALVP